MAGQENLIPMSERSKEEVRKIARKGGINSGKARAEKKRMKEIIELVLKMPLNAGESANIEQIHSFAEIKGKNLSVEQAMIIQQMQKALKGDLQALTFLRDTSGQKPVEQIEMNATVSDTASEIEDYVNQRTRQVPRSDN